MSERMNAGILLAAVGAVALFISLFLDWYEPDVTAWTVFEIVDVLLAVIAAFVVLVAALQFAGRRLDFDEDRWLPLIAAAALLLVVVSIVNNPPAAFGLSEDVGAWIALAGAILIGTGRDPRPAPHLRGHQLEPEGTGGQANRASHGPAGQRGRDATEQPGRPGLTATPPALEPAQRPPGRGTPRSRARVKYRGRGIRRLLGAAMIGIAAVTAAGVATAATDPDTLGKTTLEQRIVPNSDTDFKELALGPGESAYIVREEGVGTAQGGRAEPSQVAALLRPALRLPARRRGIAGPRRADRHRPVLGGDPPARGPQPPDRRRDDPPAERVR